MDHFVYIAASGAQEMMLAQAANSHNLANASTPGFKADMVSAESRYLDGVGADSRVYTIEKRKGTDLAPVTCGWTRSVDCSTARGSRYSASAGP